jgi:hypothetical protein
MQTIAKVYKKVSLNDEPSDFAYWQTCSYQDRLIALEQIRRQYHQWKHHAEPRLQRVYRVTKR